ncbi:hypothetical protein BCR32DRAFT_265583 [Anaeromyces robustus]|uniref:N-acetyltransferase domain-containing protein n=1 Tax=Anaeromyces robustus TaxID=1754192 RepID=A0A1Y1XIE2_9FUNG|nr:hypothetical protein BCR32DRAFT_265583 [Anaeromyces robustus]|eukprot:ORX85525.1 hypothetical protein BCR32DRAFT_265583 [Anaeromyces robustus]
MVIQIKELNKKDYEITRKFSIEGMDIRRYSNRPYEIYFYSNFFFLFELLRATQILAAYDNDNLVGVLMVQMKNEPTKINSICCKIQFLFFKFMLLFMFSGAGAEYQEANEKMYNEYLKTNEPDGELSFFVVDPKLQGKGIGSLLLNELQKIEKGKKIYLYTDSGCNYQFYDHKNFIKEQVKEIEMKIHNNIIPLTCFLYSKIL